MIGNQADSIQDSGNAIFGQPRLHRGPLGSSTPVIYVIDSPEHPFELGCLSSKCAATVVSLPARNWPSSLTPWPAPGLHRGDPPFGGHAQETLSELLVHAIPALEREHGLAPSKRAICGYSLGGLFALYAFTQGSGFDACACLSGSLWYEGWVAHLRGLDLDLTGRYAFFSVGSKEKKAGPRILRAVEDDMFACAEICRAHGCEVDTEVGPGGHAQHVGERFKRGIEALGRWL